MARHAGRRSSVTFTTRFAPSPTGPLHLGHAFSALLAYDMATANAGTFLLRIEDIDRARARSDWEAQILDDLSWLSLAWSAPVMRQSDRQDVYNAALDRLWSENLLFSCTCSRADISAAASAPQEGAPLHGPDGVVYPGICRDRPRTGPRPDGVLRLDMGAAMALTNPPEFNETGAGPDGQTGPIETTRETMLRRIGDVVLARRDMGTSYHLSVVLDDAAQSVTHVVRGSDLFDATCIHVTLQALLKLPTPTYHHHRLIRDNTGKRLAKRDDARALSRYRAEGATPQDIRNMLGPTPFC